MNELLSKIRNCQVCKGQLPNKPQPIIQASIKSAILIIGQAPGQKVQHSGIP
jgi:uracil-DNA glycosylase